MAACKELSGKDEGGREDAGRVTALQPSTRSLPLAVLTSVQRRMSALPASSDEDAGRMPSFSAVILDKREAGWKPAHPIHKTFGRPCGGNVPQPLTVTSNGLIAWAAAATALESAGIRETGTSPRNFNVRCRLSSRAQLARTSAKAERS